MKRIQKILFILVGVLSVCVGTHLRASVVRAQSLQLDVVVSPSVSFLKLQPGSTAVYTVTVENTGQREVTLQPMIVDFTSDNLTGIPVLQNSLSFPYFDDADTLPPLTLTPGASAQAKLSITIPAGAPNAEYPMTILFETPRNSLNTPSGQIGSQAQIGSNLIVLVTNDEKTIPDISIESLKTQSLVDSFQRITFAPVVRNHSFAGVIASGSAEIKDWRGSTVSSYQLPPQVILGNAARALLATDPQSSNIPTLEDQEDAGIIQPTYEPAFLLGPYWITTTIRAEGSEAPLVVTDTRIVIALPFAVLLGCATVLAIWLGYVWYERKKYL